MRQFYLVAAIIGGIVPYATYFGYLAAVPGASGALGLVWASPISAATLADFSIACMVFWVLVYRESRRIGLAHWWWLIPATMVIGLSFALPAFLYLREGVLQRKSLADDDRAV